MIEMWAQVTYVLARAHLGYAAIDYERASRSGGPYVSCIRSLSVTLYGSRSRDNVVLRCRKYKVWCARVLLSVRKLEGFKGFGYFKARGPNPSINPTSNAQTVFRQDMRRIAAGCRTLSI